MGTNVRFVRFHSNHLSVTGKLTATVRKMWICIDVNNTNTSTILNMLVKTLQVHSLIYTAVGGRSGEWGGGELLRRTR